MNSVEGDLAVYHSLVALVSERQAARHGMMRRFGIGLKIPILPTIANVVSDKPAVLEQKRDTYPLVPVCFRRRELPQRDLDFRIECVELEP